MKCPKCGSEDVEWLGSDFDECSWWWEAKCRKCGHKFGGGGSEK